MKPPFPSASYTIPNGVTSIGIGAFAFDGSLGVVDFSVTVPGSVTNIEYGAFFAGPDNFINYTIFFEGNAPSAGSSVFNTNWGYSTVYYLPGTIGWSNTFDGAPRHSGRCHTR